MANRLKGEVEVELGEGDQKRTVVFRLGVNELIELQQALGVKEDEEFLNVVALMTKKLRSLRAIRLSVYCALKKFQPDITEEAAGDIIGELGPKRIGEIIREVITWAMPDPEPRADRGKGAAASPGATPS